MSGPLSTNILVSSKHYATILKEYNDQLSKNGKVNAGKFHREFIIPRMPTYKVQNWYKFLQRFRTSIGTIEARLTAAPLVAPDQAANQELALRDRLLTMNEASRKGILKMLNIGNEELDNLLDNPHLLTSKEKINLLLQAMKATDSRAKASVDLKRDEREQKMFDESFSDAAYS